MWINDENYKDYLVGITIIEFSGEGCANCYSLMPLLHKLISKRNDCKLYHCEVGENTSKLLEIFKIEAVPTILVLNELNEISRVRGFQPEEILELWLDAKIEDAKNF